MHLGLTHVGINGHSCRGYSIVVLHAGLLDSGTLGIYENEEGNQKQDSGLCFVSLHHSPVWTPIFTQGKRWLMSTRTVLHGLKPCHSDLMQQAFKG